MFGFHQETLAIISAAFIVGYCVNDSAKQIDNRIYKFFEFIEEKFNEVGKQLDSIQDQLSNISYLIREKEKNLEDSMLADWIKSNIEKQND